MGYDLSMRLAYLLPLLLSGCLLPDVFYIGELNAEDQAIFRKAASMEHVNVVTVPVPGAWWVKYGSPTHDNGLTVPGVVFIRRDHATTCGQDQSMFVTMRHEIGHTQGLPDSDDPTSIMADPTPCNPTD